jgi:hypothetical protein
MENTAKTDTYKSLNIHQKINAKSNRLYYGSSEVRLEKLITRDPNMFAPVGKMLLKCETKTNWPAYEIKY